MSAELLTRPFAMERELVLTASICILNHFLSSWREIACVLSMQVSMGVSWSLNFRSSLAVWSDLVDSIRLPWLLKFAATTFMCFDVELADRVALISATMLLGSGLVFSGMPLGRNCATILEGW